MRVQQSVQLYIPLPLPSMGKEGLEWRRKYEAVDELLDANPRLIELVHADIQRVLSASEAGREADFTTEQIFRALIVMYLEGVSYRKCVVMLSASEFLRDFVRIGMGMPMGHTLLCQAYRAISAETWRQVNACLNRRAVEDGLVSGEQLRLDTTAREANIHYPTDATLLWDSMRAIARLVGHLRAEFPELGLTCRFHLRKSKRRMLYIARRGKSPLKHTQRAVKRNYKELIADVERGLAIARDVLRRAADLNVSSQDRHIRELTDHVPVIACVVDQTQRRVFHGETVPASEKVYSIFEPHTELLIRGKAGKKIEFGHMVLIGQTKEKYVSYYEVLEKRVSDASLLPDALKAHEATFGEGALKVLAADKGFYESMAQLEAMEQRIPTVSIAKKGKRTAAQAERERTEAFREGQRFRAGIEGSISVLKRVFRLGRCLYKGFTSFAASVGFGVFCHNLVLLSRC